MTRWVGRLKREIGDAKGIIEAEGREPGPRALDRAEQARSLNTSRIEPRALRRGLLPGLGASAHTNSQGSTSPLDTPCPRAADGHRRRPRSPA